MKDPFQKEKDLIPHYDYHLEYYSPLKDGEYFQYMCENLGVDLNAINSVLDLGCGDGRLCKNLTHRQDYLGVDYSQKRINKATNNYPNKRFLTSCIHEYCENQIQKYDLVVMTEVLEHLESPYEIIKQLKNYNKDVQIIATVPINLPYIAHLSVWKTKDEVQRDLNPDLILVDEKYGSRHFLCFWGMEKSP